MKLSFAPLEGITNSIYRNTHNKFFGGCDEYYAPFIVPSDDERITKKSIKDILPENNSNCKLQVQVLTNKSDSFFKFEKVISNLGYNEVNINLGCPSGTVVSKGRGAGFLRDIDNLDKFLYEIYEKTNLKVSLKTRIGFYDGSEFEELLKIYNKYNVSKLIVHPRVREDYYKGIPDVKVFDFTYNNSVNPLCYNGNIFSVEDYKKIVEKYPDVEGVMLGRGAVANPAIFREIKGGAKLRTEEVVSFTENLTGFYMEVLKSETFTLHKLKEIWFYMINNYPNEKKVAKSIKKSQKLSEFLAALKNLPEILEG
ncbi:MAG: tRNA-dihydrouridine synthase family protein [Clostridia bacterium]|nr:tRNA-dihydrouridine synthase family protein [Clostridia bacterium]